SGVRSAYVFTNAGYMKTSGAISAGSPEKAGVAGSGSGTSIDEAMDRPPSGRASHAASHAPPPTHPLLPRAVDALARPRRLLLRAAPGAGKTTRVPAALLDAGVAGRGSVLVLEPRRIAARAAAEYVAAARGGMVGGDVGYRVRFEHRGGATTRLWFVTEG